MYTPFSGEPLHHNYSDRLLQHFGLQSNSSSFAVFFEEPNHKAFMSMCQETKKNAKLLYSDNILHSLALYTLWLSGLMGVNVDPIALSNEQKCGFRDFLKTHNYTKLGLNFPTYISSLNCEDTLSTERYQNLEGRLSSTYLRYDEIDVTHFWGNIPEIRFDDQQGFLLTGRIIGELFDPQRVYKAFKSTDGVKTYFSTQFDYYFKDGMIAQAVGYDTSNRQDRERYRKKLIAFWSFAMTQGITTRLMIDLYKVLRG